MVPWEPRGYRRKRSRDYHPPPPTPPAIVPRVCECHVVCEGQPGVEKSRDGHVQSHDVGGSKAVKIGRSYTNISEPNLSSGNHTRSHDQEHVNVTAVVRVEGRSCDLSHVNVTSGAVRAPGTESRSGDQEHDLCKANVKGRSSRNVLQLDYSSSSSDSDSGGVQAEKIRRMN